MDWQDALNGTQSDEEVLFVSKDFLAMWSPLEMARLPVDVQIGRLNDAEQISEYALQLTQARLAFTGSLTDGVLLERMLRFMTQASARLAQLAHVRKTRSAERQQTG